MQPKPTRNLSQWEVDAQPSKEGVGESLARLQICYGLVPASGSVTQDLPFILNKTVYCAFIAMFNNSK